MRTFRLVLAAAVIGGTAVAGGVVSAAPALAATTAPLPPGATYYTFGGTGDQEDPHVSGDLVAYTSQLNGNSQVVVHDLGNGTEVPIDTQGGLDFLPDVLGTTVTYTRLADTAEVMTYDTATKAQTVIDPQPKDNRRESAVGASTLVWQDFNDTGDLATPEITGYDRSSGAVTRLTDDLLMDKDPAVSPDGNLAVWTKCQQDGTGCHIWQATHSTSGWSAPAQLTSAGEQAFPATDGSTVVYSSTPTGGTPGDEDIFWQPAGGGAVHQLALPGEQTWPVISNGVITFQWLDESTAVPNFDIYLYDIATDTLYRLTDTATDEVLADVDVTADRQVTAAWTEYGASDDIAAVRFRLPALPATLSLSPASGTGDVGTTHTVTAQVDDAAGGPVAAVTVRFTVTGSVSSTGSCVTDSTGACGYTYAGPAAAGADAIDAYADTNGSGSIDGGEPSGQATWSWQEIASTPGKSTGGGQIDGPEGPVAFGFSANSTSTGIKGTCNVVDQAAGVTLDCTDVTGYVQSGDTARIEGHATVNGVPTTYTITVADNGEPGTGTDTFALGTGSGYARSGTLTAGNIQVHD